MSKLEVDKIDPQSGTDLELGTSGDTITIPAGVTFDSSAATNTLPSTVVTTTGTQTLTNKSIVASQLTGTVAASNLGTGTADATTFLRGDQTYAEAGGGKVLQVVSTNKSDTWSSSGTGNFQAVTGLSLSITPASTSNKIFIVSSVQLYQGDYGGGISIFRGGSQIVTPASVGSRSVANASSYAGYVQSSSNLALSYLDSPSSTSALTYQIYAFVRSGTYYINRSSTDTDSNDFARTISTITAFEIAG